MDEKTSTVVTSNGVKVTDEMLDRWAKGFEDEDWPGNRTVVIGRPRLAAEEMKPVTVKLPKSKLNALDKKAASDGKTRSEFLRSLIDEALTSV